MQFSARPGNLTNDMTATGVPEVMEPVQVSNMKSRGEKVNGALCALWLPYVLTSHHPWPFEQSSPTGGGAAGLCPSTRSHQGDTRSSCQGPDKLHGSDRTSLLACSLPPEQLGLQFNHVLRRNPGAAPGLGGDCNLGVLQNAVPPGRGGVFGEV